MNIEDTLRKLIEDSDLNLKQIAKRANVDYMTTWRWYAQKTRSLNVIMAEHIYKTLTGNSFTK